MRTIRGRRIGAMKGLQGLQLFRQVIKSSVKARVFSFKGGHVRLYGGEMLLNLVKLGLDWWRRGGLWWRWLRGCLLSIGK